MPAHRASAQLHNTLRDALATTATGVLPLSWMSHISRPLRNTLNWL